MQPIHVSGLKTACQTLLLVFVSSIYKNYFILKHVSLKMKQTLIK